VLKFDNLYNTYDSVCEDDSWIYGK